MSTTSNKESKIKIYEALLVGLDGFYTVKKLREAPEYLFLPIKQSINAYLESQPIYDEPTINKRTFKIDVKKSYKDKLRYYEVEL